MSKRSQATQSGWENRKGTLTQFIAAAGTLLYVGMPLPKPDSQSVLHPEGSGVAVGCYLPSPLSSRFTDANNGVRGFMHPAGLSRS
jgi:hypothetical protein